MTGEHQANATGVAQHAHSELEQSGSDGGPHLMSVCLIRWVLMARCIMRSTGVSSAGCTANRLLSGIGNDSHPLAHRYARQNVVHQVGGRLRHSSRAARRTDAAPLATERDQRVTRAALAGQAHEFAGEDAAIQIGGEFVFDELGWTRAATGVVYFGGKRRIVLPRHAVERGLFGAAALVMRRGCSRCALGRCAHGSVGKVFFEASIIYSYSLV